MILPDVWTTLTENPERLVDVIHTSSHSSLALSCKTVELARVDAVLRHVTGPRSQARPHRSCHRRWADVGAQHKNVLYGIVV